MKTWFITGISSGLGKALATAIIANGDFVIGTFRNQTQVDAFNNTFKNKAFAVLLDVTSDESILACTEIVLSKFKTIDVVVNNAGIGFIGAIEETSIQETKMVFEANFFGTLKITQAFLPQLRKQKHGHIVQISSHGGLKAFAGFGIYNASKFAIEGFTEALAQEVKPLGIKVSLVEPGPFRTKFAGSSLYEAETIIEDYNQTAGVFRSKLKGVDGKQEGSPEKAAKAIINLVYTENPTLRMPLGKTALVTIGMKLESVASDIKRHEKTASNAVF